jgi:nicotinamide-nucleotide amidase
MKRVQIMAIGSELLGPFFQDSDSLYLTQRLNDLGLRVTTKTVASDSHEALFLQMKIALAQSDLIFATGGLGPTEDDRTREVLAEVLERKLVVNENLLAKLEERFARRGVPMPESNRKQALIPEGAEILPNEHGTAAGLWLNTGKSILVALPGPPHEMRPMFDSQVWPRLEQFREGYCSRKVLKLTGLGESAMEDMVKDIYPREEDVQVTTLASPGQLEVHISSFATLGPELADQRLDEVAGSFLDRLKEYVFSTKGEDLETVVAALLKASHRTVATAESCTGGLLSHRLTNVPGSSDYFVEGIISYSNSAKTDELQIPPDHLRKFGAVSSQVAKGMATAVRSKARTTYGLGITGIAGPSGGTEEKPVGLVYVALAWESDVGVAKNQFFGNREQVKFQASQKALDMLRRHLLAGGGKD